MLHNRDDKERGKRSSVAKRPKWQGLGTIGRIERFFEGSE
jgi:hypothetical protein